MKRPYLLVTVGTLVALLGVAAVAAFRPDVLAVGRAMKVEDFGAYWTGTVVNLHGGNAYDSGALVPLQREIEPTRETPLPAWSPPWTFAALAPLAPLNYSAARWMWLFVQLGTVLGCVTALWGMYGGLATRTGTAWLAALLWYPTIQTFGLGQHSSLVLLGVAGWVACLSAGRPFLAGLFLGLVLVKPQNLHLLGLLSTIWMFDRKAWRFALGGLLSATVLTLGAVVPNPDVFSQYRDALAVRPPSEMIPPTIGTLLRLAFGSERFWLAFVPTATAAVWGTWYYLRNRKNWEWPARLPIVLFVSYMTSPYGWVYDQILFLVPLTQVLALASLRRPPLTTPILLSVATITAVCLGLNFARFQEFTFVWLAPLTLGLYLVAMRAMRSGSQESFLE